MALLTPAHQEKNALSAPSKPAACPAVIWSNDSAGSITLSRTMARMWVGNIWAYVSPSSVP